MEQGAICHGDDALSKDSDGGGSGNGKAAVGASGDNKRVPSTTSFRPEAAVTAAAMVATPAGGAGSAGRLALAEVKVRGGAGCGAVRCGTARCDAMRLVVAGTAIGMP